MKNIYKAFINGAVIITMLLLALNAYERFYY